MSEITDKLDEIDFNIARRRRMLDREYRRRQLRRLWLIAAGWGVGLMLGLVAGIRWAGR